MTVIYESPDARDYAQGTIIVHPIYGYVECTALCDGLRYWRSLKRWERKRVRKYLENTPTAAPQPAQATTKQPEGSTTLPPRPKLVDEAYRTGYSNGWFDKHRNSSYNADPGRAIG